MAPVKQTLINLTDPERGRPRQGRGNSFSSSLPGALPPATHIHPLRGLTSSPTARSIRPSNLFSFRRAAPSFPPPWSFPRRRGPQVLPWRESIPTFNIQSQIFNTPPPAESAQTIASRYGVQPRHSRGGGNPSPHSIFNLKSPIRPVCPSRVCP